MERNPRVGIALSGSHAIQRTLWRSSIKTTSNNSPVFNPMFNAIFSGRVKSQPDWRKTESNTSSHVESENSRSTMVTRQSRSTNSDTSVSTRRQTVKKRTIRLSVKTKSTREIGGTHVWIAETTR